MNASATSTIRLPRYLESSSKGTRPCADSAILIGCVLASLDPMNRYIVFGVTILLGLVASVYYGWFARSVEISDAAPSLLRVDFKADYALMVAESFASDKDIERAIEHLVFLDSDNPRSPVVAAIEFGQDEGYSQDDLVLLAALAEALRDYDPDFLATPTP